MSEKKGIKAFDTNSFKKVLTYTKPYKSRFYWVIFWAIALSLFAAVRPKLLVEVVDAYIQKNNETGLFYYIILMAIMLLLEVMAQFYFVYLANLLGQDVVKDIRIKLFEKLVSFKIRYYDHSPVGQLVTRSVSDLEAISRIFSQGLFMILSDLLKMIVVLFFMFFMNWKLSLVVVLAMPFLLIATRVFQQKMKIAFEEVRNQVANLNTFVQERISGMKIIQLFSREKIEYEKFKEINQKHNQAWIKTVWYNSIFFPIADFISSITLGIIVWYGSLLILDGNTQTSFGQLFSYTMYIGMLFNPLRQIADKFNEMQMGMIAANRVFSILDVEEEVQNEGKMVASKFEGKIVFSNVYFSYKDNEPVINDFTYTVNPGETIAIVGATGAGKSTIINLLNRFYDIQKGEIKIDDHNITSYTLYSLRKQIGVVLQDVFLFADTIYNNITLNNPTITKEEVIQASKKIGLHDFIMSLPNNYDYNVKERGAMLSSGQRQLIAFLRAFINNPSILILDEATSSIDTYSEELIQKATQLITQNRTSIIIAHRLATISNADKIIVMDRGNIVEVGTHAQLLKKLDGVYKNLYDAQFATEK